MQPADFKNFSEAWKAGQEVTGTPVTDAALAIAFKILEPYPLEQVQDGIMAHLSDPDSGRYAPKPADIIHQISTSLANDGRPDPDEAWAIAVQSMDEYKTVVLNDEIAASLQFSAPIYHDGDKVGARMAFRSSYEKAIAEARKNQTPVHWFPSLGFDANDRKAALEKAVSRGLLPAAQVSKLLPEPITEEGSKVIGYITGKSNQLPGNADTVKKFEKLRQAVNKTIQSSGE